MLRCPFQKIVNKPLDFWFEFIYFEVTYNSATNINVKEIKSHGQRAYLDLCGSWSWRGNGEFTWFLRFWIWELLFGWSSIVWLPRKVGSPYIHKGISKATGIYFYLIVNWEQSSFGKQSYSIFYLVLVKFHVIVLTR